MDPILSPGLPDQCAGRDECCDECDHFLDCFPEYEQRKEAKQ